MEDHLLPAMEVPEVPLFDVETYSSRYSGYALISRLRFIAEKSTICSIKSTAYRLLDEALKAGVNSSMYREVFSNDEYFYEGFKYNAGWVEEIEQQSAQRLERLKSELRAAKSSMIKESLRIVNNDLGDFYYERGDLVEAMKSYSRVREFISMPRHEEEMAVNVLIVSVGLNRLYNVSNFVGKLKEDVAQVTKDKLRAALGLLHVSQSDYKRAAVYLLGVEGGIIGRFQHVIAAQDIAVLGTVCSLATLDRTALRNDLLGSRSFRSVLELVPPLRLLVQDFLGGDYPSASRRLQELRPSLEMDLFFSTHVNKVYALIRERMIVQLFSPYTSLDLSRLQTILEVSSDELEKDLCALIANGRLQAQIDIAGNTLRRRVTDERAEALQAVVRAAEACEANMRRSLLRLSLQANGFMVSLAEPYPEGMGGMHVSLGVDQGGCGSPDGFNDDMEAV